MTRDYAVAFQRARQEAEEGHGAAQFRLALHYGLGLGCVQDYAKAVHWNRQAARQGLARAQANLGFMYGTGRGVPQDYVSAYAWYNLAAAGGQDAARANRDAVAVKMTSSQIERAQDLSRQLYDELTGQ